MLIIVDRRIPQVAKERLQSWGILTELETNGIVYPQISGHPDIFFFQYKNNLVISPQLPDKYIDILNNSRINFTFGSKILELKYPKTAAYNVSAYDSIFIGNHSSTDEEILILAKDNTWIESPQAYSRCNSIILNRNHIITSEITVKRSLDNSLFVNPKEIVLEGFPNGFFGGCVGYFANKLFLLGSLSYHSQGAEIKSYCKKIDIEIIELYDGPFFDGGGIIFLKD